jgi:hypothetical protein
MPPIAAHAHTYACTLAAMHAGPSAPCTRPHTFPARRLGVAVYAAVPSGGGGGGNMYVPLSSAGTTACFLSLSRFTPTLPTHASCCLREVECFCHLSQTLFSGFVRSVGLYTGCLRRCLRHWPKVSSVRGGALWRRVCCDHGCDGGLFFLWSFPLDDKCIIWKHDLLLGFFTIIMVSSYYTNQYTNHHPTQAS